MYTEKELVRIAKRENNKKRNYLVVNRLQGKHIPVKPSKALAMFAELAELVREEYKEERLLFIGFAETATAIGAELAVRMDVPYMQTTREEIEGVEYLFFSEAHSHASEQRLIKTDLDKIIDEIDRIIFVEDEITTGNTVWNIIKLIQTIYPKEIKFSVASILNGMAPDSQRKFRQLEIGVHYLVKTEHASYARIAERYEGDGICRRCDKSDRRIPVKERRVAGRCDGRRLNRGRDYGLACMDLWREIQNLADWEEKKNILVLGTEECMYPALRIGEQLEKEGHTVHSHSTTRSPIVVSTAKDYPLHERQELVSLYDSERTTFLYDLGTYDEVFIITDAENRQRDGICSLLNALSAKGNQNIYLIRWC